MPRRLTLKHHFFASTGAGPGRGQEVSY